jgi:hypothetical protein
VGMLMSIRMVNEDKSNKVDCMQTVLLAAAVNMLGI